jgi:3-hydroxyisobutyrate dehydrogenase-like beta-hydroxyacid dehydrogenase
MTLNAQSKYPSRRTYVLKVRGDAQPGALAGRLENLVTGRQHEFASARELLDAIAAELEASGDGAAAKG